MWERIEHDMEHTEGTPAPSSATDTTVHGSGVGVRRVESNSAQPSVGLAPGSDPDRNQDDDGNRDWTDEEREWIHDFLVAREQRKGRRATRQYSSGRIGDIQRWVDRPVIARIKHVLGMISLVIILVVGVQYQLQQINNEKRASDARAQEIKDYEQDLSRYGSCVTRVETRAAVRGVLLGVYDDVIVVLPDNEQAIAFRDRGYQRINTEYPELELVPECGYPPVVPEGYEAAQQS